MGKLNFSDARTATKISPFKAEGKCKGSWMILLGELGKESLWMLLGSEVFSPSHQEPQMFILVRDCGQRIH